MSVIFGFSPARLAQATVFFVATACLFCAPLASIAGLQGGAGRHAPSGDYHTAVHWEESPAAAALAAQDNGKLLMLMHLSGNFTKVEFT